MRENFPKVGRNGALCDAMGAMHILAVEDEPRMSALLHKGFSEHGHQVMLALAGAEALKLTLDNGFDVVLLDIGLPDRNGYGVTGRIERAAVPAWDGRWRNRLQRGMAQ